MGVTSGALDVGAQSRQRGAAGLSVYVDDDSLTVLHPMATATTLVGDATRVGVEYEADIISSATVDVRTSASPAGFDETRHGFGATGSHELTRTFSVGVGLGLSLSPDYVTESGSVSVALEDGSRSRRLSLSLGAAHEWVGRAGDEEGVGDLWSAGVGLAGSSVVSRVLVVDGSVGLEMLRGYQESPYRFVPIYAADGDQIVVRIAERVPDDRVRAAARARVRVALLRWLFATGTYRFHLDDWGVAGHTVEGKMALDLGSSWLVSVGGRVYAQRGASFYRGYYRSFPDVPRWRTLDRELARSFALGAGASVERVAAHIGSFELRAALRGELTWHRYLDTPALPESLAATLGLVVSLER